MQHFLQDLRVRLDVVLGHNLIMRMDLFNGWWYDHVCLPAALWECREK